MENKDVKVSANFWVFWLAGFMFTVGYVGVDPVLHTYSWGVQIIAWILSYLLWPFILGNHLAK